MCDIVGPITKKLVKSKEIKTRDKEWHGRPLGYFRAAPKPMPYLREET